MSDECICGTDEALARGDNFSPRLDILCPKHDGPASPVSRVSDQACGCKPDGTYCDAHNPCFGTAVSRVVPPTQELGSKFTHVGPVMIGCMAKDSRDAMELALARYREHAEAMKGYQGYVPDDPVYSFAYWLFRWSGIVTGVDLNAPENPWVRP